MNRTRVPPLWTRAPPCCLHRSQPRSNEIAVTERKFLRRSSGHLQRADQRSVANRVVRIIRDVALSPSFSPFMRRRVSRRGLYWRRVIHLRTLKISGISSWCSCQTNRLQTICSKRRTSVFRRSRTDSKARVKLEALGNEFMVKAMSRSVLILNFTLVGKVWVNEIAHQSGRGYELMEQTRSLRLQFVGAETPSDVAPRSIEAATRPRLTRSVPVVNTIGMVAVARLAASAHGVFATMTAT